MVVGADGTSEGHASAVDNSKKCFDSDGSPLRGSGECGLALRQCHRSTDGSDVTARLSVLAVSAAKACHFSDNRERPTTYDAFACHV
jgi:hypothetical protein